MNTKEFIKDVNFLVNKHGLFKAQQVEDIELIIIGYQYAIAGKRDDAEAIFEFMQGFRGFVNSHFKAEKDFIWPVSIRLKSHSDKHSLELFAELFHEYEQNIGKRE